MSPSDQEIKRRELVHDLKISASNISIKMYQMEYHYSEKDKNFGFKREIFPLKIQFEAVKKYLKLKRIHESILQAMKIINSQSFS